LVFIITTSPILLAQLKCKYQTGSGDDKKKTIPLAQLKCKYQTGSGDNNKKNNPGSCKSNYHTITTTTPPSDIDG
jgi:hypothetical protein